MWGYYLQVPEGALASVLVDDQERQQSSSVPFGKVHPEVKAGFESRLADLVPSLLFELVQQCGNSSIQAIYSVPARSYARDRVCLVGDTGAVFPPFPCFCGGFADRSDPTAVVIRPGYLDSNWTTESWTDQGVRNKVGASHWPLPELVHAFLDAGLTPKRLFEGGTPVPTVLAIRARKN